MTTSETPTDAQAVAALAARAADMHTAYRTAIEQRDDAIRRALANGTGAIALARAAGLPRSRIYQIRDAH